MIEYKTIDYYGNYWNLPIIAFDKLDDSNLRFEYSQKRGFYKFGTRTVLIDEKSEPFGFAISLFKEKYEKDLTEIFKSKQYRNFQNITCFCELVCESSAFGQHDFVNCLTPSTKDEREIIKIKELYELFEISNNISKYVHEDNYPILKIAYCYQLYDFDVEEFHMNQSQFGPEHLRSKIIKNDNLEFFTKIERTFE